MAKYIINGKRYNLEGSNLLCSIDEDSENEELKLDLFASRRTTDLYFPGRKEFVLDSVNRMGSHTVKVISREEAFEFMNSFPAGIDQENYIKFFGGVEEV